MISRRHNPFHALLSWLFRRQEPATRSLLDPPALNMRLIGLHMDAASNRSALR